MSSTTSYPVRVHKDSRSGGTVREHRAAATTAGILYIIGTVTGILSKTVTYFPVRGADEADIERQLKPVEAEVRKRLGNFCVAEDNDSLEAVVLPAGGSAVRAGGGFVVAGRLGFCRERLPGRGALLCDGVHDTQRIRYAGYQ